MLKRFLDSLLLLLWMGIIFYLSNQPNLRSGLIDWVDLILRKGAHMVEYGILTWLLVKVIGKKKQSVLPLAMILAALYAATDEYHQSFISGRDGNWHDWLVDVAGILISFLILKRFVREQDTEILLAKFAKKK
ncbi:MAG TPA: hypothetical protein DDX47_04775 [Candidatus Jacksonbacteria bacterium]|nr:MAG: VanZ family protein [Parcubacteria group bacterium GW2011_GWA2_42_28]KKT55904.1 MAG: VanZ family protein [Parcubacteria group bacterium GW2011_GWC2_44_22]HBH46643.1 hypothetical protein [Candidatus Jacksonbacteria bacterium]HCC49536.1 hypothetical protein [Candidatus Jacksonbacteria bacterium]HCE49542.1 hypothetical protein [Candidatus Jacksonbacteria bacterium]